MGSFFVRYGGRTQTRTGWLVAQCGARQGHRREERAATVRGALRQDDPTGPVASLWAAKNGGRQPGCGRAAAAGPRRPIKRSLKAPITSSSAVPCPRPRRRATRAHRTRAGARRSTDRRSRVPPGRSSARSSPPVPAGQTLHVRCSQRFSRLSACGRDVRLRTTIPSPRGGSRRAFPPIPRASATADTRVRGFPRRDDGPASAIVAA